MDGLVELDGQLNLSFQGGELVASGNYDRLVLRGFARVAWDWREYGSRKEHHETFFDGEVTFAAPLG